MKNRVFYEKRTLKKFRIVFETAEIVVGASRKNKYSTFRKDTGVIAFSRREALEMRLHDLTNKPNLKVEKNDKSRFRRFESSALSFNYS